MRPKSPPSTSHRSAPTDVPPPVRLSNLIFAGLLRFFGPGITAFAKEFGLGESLKLKDMRAALYPVWRCDVLLEGKVRNEYSKEKRETRGVVGVEGGYVPGQLRLELRVPLRPGPLSRADGVG